MTIEVRPGTVSPQKDRFQWSRHQDYEKLKVLMDIWSTLSSLERQVYASMRTVSINPQGSGNSAGDTARLIGAQDIEEESIGICGSSSPLRVEKSATAEKLADDIEENLLRGMSDRRANIESYQLVRMFYALGEISTRYLPDEPSVLSPDWKKHYRLEKEAFWTWLVEDGTMPENPPF